MFVLFDKKYDGVCHGNFSSYSDMYDYLYSDVPSGHLKSMIALEIYGTRTRVYDVCYDGIDIYILRND